ncbi:MAG: hypothetical protein LUE27_00415, partial [Clostridia bacterium]|nr:hypothetical protein [Clostridia bacterium]
MTENKELTKDELRLLELMRGLGEGYWAGDLQIRMDLGWTRAKTKKVSRELTVRGYMKRMT